MRIFILALVLIFGLQSWTNADDIGDFQIEGMGIGDSALDFYSKNEIKKNKKNYTKDKTFSVIEIQNFDSKMYDGIQLKYKTKDKNYKIQGISGIVDCRNDLSICENIFEKIENELSDFFGNRVEKSKKKTKKHSADKSGKSFTTSIYFHFKNGDRASIQMIDWSNEIGYWDHLRISIGTKEINYWYDNKAYK